MNINTSNRDVRDAGIAAGVVILVNIVWGLSSDLINQRRGKKAEKPTDTRTTAEMLADTEASVKDLHVQIEATAQAMDTLGESLDVCQDELDKLSAVVFTPEQVKEVTKVAETLMDPLEATFPGTASIVEDVLTSREIPAEEVPVEVKDLGTFANVAGEAAEAFSDLLEDPEASTKELEEAQSLCKNALKSYLQMINMLEGVDVTDHQYRYANILSCYELKLPALKKAKAANVRKAKTVK